MTSTVHRSTFNVTGDFFTPSLMHDTLLPPQTSRSRPTYAHAKMTSGLERLRLPINTAQLRPLSLGMRAPSSYRPLRRNLLPKHET